MCSGTHQGQPLKWGESSHLQPSLAKKINEGRKARRCVWLPRRRAELAKWVLSPPSGASAGGGAAAYADSSDFTGSNAVIEEMAKRLVLSDDEVSRWCQGRRGGQADCTSPGQQCKQTLLWVSWEPVGAIVRVLWRRLGVRAGAGEEAVGARHQGQGRRVLHGRHAARRAGALPVRDLLPQGTQQAGWNVRCQSHPRASCARRACVRRRSCAEVCKVSNDLVWYGAAVEGVAAARLVLASKAQPTAAAPNGAADGAAHVTSSSRKSAAAAAGAAPQAQTHRFTPEPRGRGGPRHRPTHGVQRVRWRRLCVWAAGFAPHTFWRGVRQSGVEGEVRELLGDARAAYKRRGGCPALVVEQNLKLVRLAVGLKGEPLAQRAQLRAWEP